MARRLIILLAVLLLTACLPTPPTPAVPVSPPQFSGVLSGTTVLAGEVEMSDDVLVPAGSTLVLRAGTTVLVRPSESTKIDPEYLSSMTELLVRGRLRIEGTAEAPVRFLPLGQPAGEIWWAGIALDGADESSIEGAELSGAETGILCLRSSPRLQGNRLYGCRYGIIVQLESHPDILDNRLEAGEGGVFCWRGSAPLLAGNRIANHGEEGLFVDLGSRPRLGRNQITGNAVGVALYPRDLDLAALELVGNRQDRQWLGSEATP